MPPKEENETNVHYAYLLGQANTMLRSTFTHATVTASLGAGNTQETHRIMTKHALSQALAYIQLTGQYGFGEAAQKSQRDLEEEAKKLTEEIENSQQFKEVMDSMDPKEMKSFLGKKDKEGKWMAKGAGEIATDFQKKSKEVAVHKKWMEQAKDRAPRAKNLVTQLEQSTQKSILGKIKSFFVGNSQQYKAAFKAMQDLANGKVQTQEQREAAKDAIEDYVMNRGDKVRDHQYGRDRFDAMMKGLGEIMEPEEFLETVNRINRLREERSHTRENAINGEDYLPDGPGKDAYKKVKAAYDKQQKIQHQKEVSYLAERRQESRQAAWEAEPDQMRLRDDAQTIEADAKRLAQWKKSRNPDPQTRPKSMMERNQEYLDMLRKVTPQQLANQEFKNRFTEKVNTHLRDHPSFRILADSIIKERGMDNLFQVPDFHKTLGGESREVLDQQIKHLWNLDVQKHPELKDKEPPQVGVDAPQKDQQPKVEKPQGPQVGGPG